MAPWRRCVGPYSEALMRVETTYSIGVLMGRVGFIPFLTLHLCCLMLLCVPLDVQNEDGPGPWGSRPGVGISRSLSTG